MVTTNGLESSEGAVIWLGIGESRTGLSLMIGCEESLNSKYYNQEPHYWKQYKLLPVFWKLISVVLVQLMDQDHKNDEKVSQKEEVKSYI